MKKRKKINRRFLISLGSKVTNHGVTPNIIGRSHTRAMLKHSKASERMVVCLPFSWYLAIMYHRARGGGSCAS